MTPVQQASIIRGVQLDISVNGVPPTLAALEAIVQQIAALNNIASLTPAQLTKIVTNLNAAANAANSAGKAFDNAKDSTSSFEKGLGGLVGTMGNLKGAVGSLLSPLSSLSSLVGGDGFGFGSALQLGDKYNKMLLETSANFNKYGVGAATMKKSIESISEKTGLLRGDTVRLMQTYERGFNFISLQSGEKLMMNLKNAVGANAQAMEGMMSTLANVVSKFPDLERSITRLDDLDKQRLGTQNRLLVMTGQLSLSEAKRFQDYINQNKQKSAADKEAKKQAEDQINAMNAIKKALEDMALAIKDGIIKYIKEAADWIKKNKGWILEWVPTIAKVGAALAIAVTVGNSLWYTFKGIQGTLKSISGLGSIFGNARLTKLIGENAGASMKDVAGLAEQTGGKSIGLMGRTGSAIAARPMASLGVAAVGAAAGYGAGKGIDALYSFFSGGKRLQEQTGGKGVALEVGKAAGTIAAGALAGAVVGSIIPGVGTAVGAVLGAVGATVVAGYNAVMHYKEVQAIHREESYRTGQDHEEWKKYQEEMGKQMQKSYDAALMFGDKAQAQLIAMGGNTQRQESKADEEIARNVRAGKTGDEALSGKEHDKLMDQREAEMDQIESQLGAAQQAGDEAATKYYAAVVDAKKAAWAFTDLKQIKAASGDVDNSAMQEASQARIDADAKRRAAEDEYNAQRAGQRDEAAAKAKEYMDQAAAAKNADRNAKLLGLQQSVEMRAGNFDALAVGQQQEARLNALSGNQIQSNLGDTTKEKSALTEAGLGGLTQTQNAGNDSYQAMQAGKETLDNLIKQNEQELKIAKSDAAKLVFEEKLKTFRAAQEKLGIMISKADAQRNPILKEQEQTQGNLLAAENERKMVIEAQEKLMQSQLSLLEAIVQQQSITGNVDYASAAKSVEDAVDAINKAQADRRTQLAAEIKDQKELAEYDQMRIERAQAILKAKTGTDGTDLKKSAEAVRSLPEEDQKKAMEAIGDLLDANHAKDVSALAIQSKMAEQKKADAEAEPQRIAARLKVADIYKGQLDMAKSMSSQAELQVQLADNLAIGFTASAEQRMISARAVEREIGLMQEQKEALEQQMAISNDPDARLKFATEIMNKENEITQAKIKQANILKTIRDGYVSAINAMTIGTGLIGKFIIDQNKNVGIGIKYLGVMQSMTAGGMGHGADSRGARSASGFSSTGFYGPRDMNRPDFYNGGGALAQEVAAKTGQLSHEAAQTSMSAANAMVTASDKMNAAADIQAAGVKYLDESLKRFNAGGANGAYGANDTNTGRIVQQHTGEQTPPGTSTQSKATGLQSGPVVGSPDGVMIKAHPGELVFNLKDQAKLAKELGIPVREIRKHMSNGHLDQKWLDKERADHRHGELAAMAAKGFIHISERPKSGAAKPAGPTASDVGKAARPQEATAAPGAPGGTQAQTAHPAEAAKDTGAAKGGAVPTPAPAPAQPSAPLAKENLPVWAKGRFSNPEIDAKRGAVAANNNTVDQATAQAAADKAAAEAQAKIEQAKKDHEEAVAAQKANALSSLSPDAVSLPVAFSMMIANLKNAWEAPAPGGMRDLLEDVGMWRAGRFVKKVDSYDTAWGSIIDRSKQDKIDAGRADFDKLDQQQPVWDQNNDKIGAIKSGMAGLPGWHDQAASDMAGLLINADPKDQNGYNEFDKYANAADDRVAQLKSGKTGLEKNFEDTNKQIDALSKEYASDLNDWEQRAGNQSLWIGQRKNMYPEYGNWVGAARGLYDDENVPWERSQLMSQWYYPSKGILNTTYSAREDDVVSEINDLSKVVDDYGNKRSSKMAQWADAAQKIKLDKEKADADANKLAVQKSEAIKRANSEAAAKKIRDDAKAAQDAAIAETGYQIKYSSEHDGAYMPSSVGKFLAEHGYDEKFISEYKKKYGSDEGAPRGLFVKGKGIYAGRGDKDLEASKKAGKDVYKGIYWGPTSMSGLPDGAYAVAGADGTPSSVFAHGLKEYPDDVANQAKLVLYQQGRDAANQDLAEQMGYTSIDDMKSQMDDLNAIRTAPKHHAGGIVKGAEGSEQIIKAQGGERVSSISDVKGTNRTGSQKAGITIENFQVMFDELNILGTKLKQRMNEEFNKAAGFGLSGDNNQYSSY